MEEVFDHVVYSKNVLEFVTVAAEYCAFTESAEKFGKREFIDKSQKILSLLYLKAALLPELEVLLDGDNEKFVSEQDWMFICNKIAKTLGDDDLFLQTGAPILTRSGDFTEVSLSEVYADIYQDLQDLISLYRLGSVEVMNDALWECRMNFEQYWGQRLLAALVTLHELLYGDTEKQF